tara:strand:- start:2246 stop:3475 length:1230 start_codon:yes stop_codon:yes gene_type:complete
MKRSSSSLPRLHVAMVIQKFRPLFSGQGVQLELLCRALLQQNIQPTVITSSYGKKTLPKYDTIDGYKVIRVDPSVFSGLLGQKNGPVFSAKIFLELLRNQAFDLVHVHAMTDAFYGAWGWSRLTSKPLLFEMTLLGTDDAITLLATNHKFSKLRQAIFRRCDGYAAISPILEQRYHEAGLASSKVRLLVQGVDVRRFSPSLYPPVREELGIPESSPVFVFVGSLVKRKGIDILLNAWIEIHKSRPDAHLILAGENRFNNDRLNRDFLSRQFKMLPENAASKIHQVGVRDDINRIMQAADIFLFPSRREGFGTVIVEAMATGLPCIVSEQSGITDFIFGRGNPAGISVPQENSSILAEQAINLLANKSQMQELGKQSRKRALALFDINDIVLQYVNFYRALLGQKNPDLS